MCGVGVIEIMNGERVWRGIVLDGIGDCQIGSKLDRKW